MRSDRGHGLLIKVELEFMQHQNGNVYIVRGLDGPCGLVGLRPRKG